MKSYLLVLSLLVVGLNASKLSVVGSALVAKFYDPATELSFYEDPEAIWDPIVDFFKGIFAGVNATFQSDLRLFNGCIHCPPKVWAAWLKFYDYLKNLSWKTFNFSTFMDHFMHFVGDTIGSAMPCIIIGMMADKFIELILDPTIERLQYTFMKTLASNFQLILNDVMKMVVSVLSGHFFVAGEYLGQVVYVIIVH